VSCGWLEAVSVTRVLPRRPGFLQQYTVLVELA
jgi:hypothetical protein